MYISSACDVVIEVTRRCNMCCAHCLRGDAEAVDIQERYIDAFLDSFANAGYISSLTFTGGEISLNIPAIYRHYLDAIQDILLEQFGEVGIYTGPWTSGKITKGESNGSQCGTKGAA